MIVFSSIKILKGDQDMEHKIVQKECFTVVGKSIQTSAAKGENSRQIPKFWQDSHAGLPDFELYPQGDTMSLDYRCEIWIPIVKQ